MRVQGKVKFFDKTKGWGFIERDDGGKDVFVHQKTLAEIPLDHLNDGDRVSFEVESVPKGDRAKNLQTI